MTMHLVGPWLSTTGKKKSKQKFKSAADAQRARELEESWKNLQKKWGIEQEERKRQRAMSAPVWNTSLTVNHRCQNDTRPKSLNSWVKGAVSSKPSQQYTGDKILGIGTMHKSNAVPVFSNEEAVDISRMRRG